MKENVIVGRLIPAGTGSSIRRLENDAAIRDEALIAENAKNVENEEIDSGIIIIKNTVFFLTENKYKATKTTLMTGRRNFPKRCRAIRKKL